MRNRDQIMSYDLSVWIWTNKSKLPNSKYKFPITNQP